MRDAFPGHYRPTKEEFDALWAEAIFVPDTNVLLALYRLAEASRDKLLTLFDAHSDHLFLPHQVAAEFQRRRIGVIEDQLSTYRTVEDKLRKLPASIGSDIGRHPYLDRGALEKQIRDALAPALKDLEESREKHPDPRQAGDSIGPDLIRDAVDRHFAGKIGTPQDVDELIKVGKARYEDKLPPGYEDHKKPEPACYGDLAIWFEMLARAKSEGKPVVFITEERKADWWWKDRDDELVGPRVELVEEMRREAGQRFYAYRLEPFMAEASKRLGIAFSEEERDDVARAGEEVATVFSNPPFVVHDSLEGSPWRNFQTFRVTSPQSTGFFEGNWVTSLRVDGEEAELGITYQSPATVWFSSGSTLICNVVSPSGRLSAFSVSGNTMEASAVYPRDFPDAPQETGSHAYTWLKREIWPEGRLGGDTQIASGTFDLGPAEPQPEPDEQAGDEP